MGSATTASRVGKSLAAIRDWQSRSVCGRKRALLRHCGVNVRTACGVQYLCAIRLAWKPGCRPSRLSQQNVRPTTIHGAGKARIFTLAVVKT